MSPDADYLPVKSLELTISNRRIHCPPGVVGTGALKYTLSQIQADVGGSSIPLSASVAAHLNGSTTGCDARGAVRCGLQHPLGAADDRQEMPVTFAMPVASRQFSGLA